MQSNKTTSPDTKATGGRLLLASLNVNGIRSATRRGFASWIRQAAPDILCLQEIRITEQQLQAAFVPPSGYRLYWNHSTRPGYSGTALLSRPKPQAVRFGLDDRSGDPEGRTIVAEYPGFTLINCYVPNGNSSDERLAFKMAFYEACLDQCRRLLSEGRHVILCGDLNTAHREVDLADPSANARRSGFLPQEREWIDRLIQSGFVDTFRHFYPGVSKQYTWWPYGRERDAGWRFDYIFTSIGIIDRVRAAFILPEVACSDHCPIGIQLHVEGTPSSEPGSTLEAPDFPDDEGRCGQLTLF